MRAGQPAGCMHLEPFLLCEEVEVDWRSVCKDARASQADHNSRCSVAIHAAVSRLQKTWGWEPGVPSGGAQMPPDNMYTCITATSSDISGCVVCMTVTPQRDWCGVMRLLV
jgi:hypothetical protein